MTRVIDPYDELASLFLTSGPTDAPLRPLHAGAIKEILIVGHLPVRAGLWLTPYADARARQVGAVALLRFDVPETSLQILRAPQRIADAKDPKSLEEAVHLVASSIALWVIRPGTDCNADALIKLNPDRITLLSSADDAAVINAYQVLKSLADAANRAQCAMPSVGLAVVGAESKSAAITIDRLNRTATANLNLEISLDLCLPRMDAGIRSTRYMSFPASASAQNSANAPPSPINALATISQAFNWITAAEKDAIHIPEPIPFPVQTPLPAPVTPPPMRPAASAPQPTIESPKPRAEAQPQQVEPPASQVAPTSAQPPAMSGVASQPSITTQSTTGVQPAPHKLAPKQPCLEELKEPARASEPDVQGKPLGLTGCVEGLIALPFRKPDHERVELAVDANGTLHLLTREMNLRDLRIVEVWARKHRELIMLACPQITLNVAAEMVSHLFADDPSDLMDLHGTGIQLHILARANVGLEDDGVGTERQVGGWYHGQLTKCSQPTRRPAANSSEHADCLIH